MLQFGTGLLFLCHVKKKDMDTSSKTNMVVSDKVLKSLCQEYLYEIGTGLGGYLPSIKVRYVMDDNKFGYAYFGDFFFFDDDFYVWNSDDLWKEDHNQEVVEGVFKDQCEGRGYAHRAIFAGVETVFVDSAGERIFTGDVLKVEKGEAYIKFLAVGAWTHMDGAGDYCFILDNHNWPLADCARQNYKMTRVGTVFYQLEGCDPIGVNERTMQFNGWRDTDEDRQRKALMAKYTPNFDQEEWKYMALEVLGAEYNWRD